MGISKGQNIDGHVSQFVCSFPAVLAPLLWRKLFLLGLKLLSDLDWPFCSTLFKFPFHYTVISVILHITVKIQTTQIKPNQLNKSQVMSCCVSVQELQSLETEEIWRMFPAASSWDEEVFLWLLVQRCTLRILEAVLNNSDHPLHNILMEQNASKRCCGQAF